jgi:hypothetical protein
VASLVIARTAAAPARPVPDSASAAMICVRRGRRVGRGRAARSAGCRCHRRQQPWSKAGIEPVGTLCSSCGVPGEPSLQRACPSPAYHAYSGYRPSLTSKEGILHPIKVISNWAGHPAIQAPAPRNARTWPRNDSQRYSPCLCGTLREILAEVCEVMRVLHLVKPATVRASYCYSIFTSGLSTVQT